MSVVLTPSTVAHPVLPAQKHGKALVVCRRSAFEQKAAQLKPPSSRPCTAARPPRLPNSRKVERLARKAASSAVQQQEPAPPAETSGRHAILHDFCMAIPYGGVIGLAGLVSLFFKSGSAGLAALFLATVLEILAFSSLANWRQGKSSMVFTTGSAGIAIAMTSFFWKQAHLGIAVLFSYCLCAVSGAMSVFLLYNIAAGGNPPKRSEPADEVPPP